jgi:glycosyltransferase involved in cell wall biosynthesis
VHRLKREDVHFGLIGDGPERPALEAYAKLMAVTDYVTFSGHVDDAALLELISTSDVCVNCDEVNKMNDKSTMNKIMEYMALGKPIVQFDVKEGRVTAQEAALYARPNDALDLAEKILLLLESEEARERMGAAGRARVETVLAWHHQVPMLLSAYESLLKARRPASRAGDSDITRIPLDTNCAGQLPSQNRSVRLSEEDAK